jgi:hypothetical protein
LIILWLQEVAAAGVQTEQVAAVAQVVYEQPQVL